MGVKPPGPATYPKSEPAKGPIRSNGHPATPAGCAADPTGLGYANKQGSSAAVAPREATSQALLRMSWDAVSPSRALWQEQPPSAAEALATLAGHDPRPLLVLRECEY